jgi:hypothetical protein
VAWWRPGRADRGLGHVERQRALGAGAERWPGVRTTHEQWLAPANFAETGQQWVSLSSLTCGTV